MVVRGKATIGLAGLALGALMVGVAIELEGDPGRYVNGLGGLLWFASTALLTLAATRTRPPAWLWAVLALVVVAVAFVVTPSAILPAVIGFVTAGLLLGALAPGAPVLWAALVPAWYLPAHIGTAVLKSAWRSMLGNEAALRTDPPPTAAIVPLVMVACAVLGGLIARSLVARRHAGGPMGDRLARR